MSRVDKLGIQGIRSFGPDEMRKIEFYSPLTLILGQNGCGKTTIIECLRYITTGEVPPGCGKGVPFVHDPKIASDSVVRGQIKLRFRSTKSQTITGSRSVEVTQKAKTMAFSSLDSTITYESPDGKKTSISNKCIDFHAEMTSLLGVAKPILESVIFCHQEDSNWPLDEGKKLKDKFDLIFNATKYIKCLDKIRNLRKEKKQSVNNMKEVLEGLRGTKELAARLRKDLQDVESSHQSIKEEQEELIKSQVPVRKRIREILAVENNIATINGEISGKEHQLKSIREMQEEWKSTQNEKINCSDTELLHLILDFERNTRLQEAKQKQSQLNLQRVNNEIDNLKKEESAALLLMGKLEAAQKANLDNINKRNRLLEELVSKYNIAGYSDRVDFDVGECENILSRVEEFLDGQKVRMTSKKREFEVKEAELQKEMDNLRSEETTLEHDIATLLKQIEDNSKKSRIVRQNLSLNEEELSSTNLEELKKSLEEIVDKIKEEEERVNVPKLKKDGESKREEKDRLERELEEVKRKVAKMNRLAAARSQFEIYVKDKNALEQKNKFLQHKNADDFQSIFSGPVGDNVRNELEAHMVNIRRQIRECGENKSKLEKKKTELGMKIENEKRVIEKIEKEIRGFESKLEDICGGRDLEAAIERSKEQIDALLKTKGDHESSTVMFRGFKEKIRAGEACPLCHRDFEEGYEKGMLIDEIEGKLNRLPYKLTQLKKDLLEKESLHESLLELRPQKEAADKAAKELETHRSELKGYYNDLEKVSVDLEAFSSHFSFLMSEEETCMRIQSDVVALDSNLKNIRQLNDKISNIQATLGTCDDDLSMDELVKHQTDLEHKVKNFQKQIEAIQEEIMEHNIRLQRLNERKIELSARELELKTKQRETETMKVEIEKLKVEKEEMEEKIERYRIAVAPIKFRLKEKMETKKAVIQEKEKFIDVETKKIEIIRDERRVALEIQRGVRAYVEEGREAALADGKKKLRAFREVSETKEAKKNDLQEEVGRIMKELTTQKERKRNLDNEKKIRDKESEAEQVEKILSSLKEKVKDLDYEKMNEEKQNLIFEETRIIKNKANLEGRLEEVKKKKREFESNLNDKRIKNAEKNYKEKLIEMKCTDVACDDLNKYFKALETAIMKFHHEKMNNINSIIREFWRTTYKGNDIDYIEIKTDETESQGADKRRTYNYRVVMVKNEVEMDMRARCSAGQKVLASLIIRMALAETFSANCGILALDEPTTNLDRENIESLSLALLNIVNKRSHQRNFQLIVITHDNEFLERLTRADFIEYYHKVSRNERGLSVITKLSAV